MIYTFIAGRCSDLPVATCCRVMKVSTSGFYQWKNQPVSLAGPSAIGAPRRVCLVSVSLSCHNRARVPGSCHAAAIARTT